MPRGRKATGEPTIRQFEYLEWIKTYITEKNQCPTLAEIGVGMGVKTGSVQSVINSMKAHNLLTWEKGHFRTIKPVTRGENAA